MFCECLNGKCRLITIMFLMLAAVVLGANSTVYVDPVSGDNGNSGAAWGDAWQTLAYAIDNHSSSSEETVTVYVPADSVHDQYLSFDNAADHNGQHFIFRTENSGDKWSMDSIYSGVSMVHIKAGVTTGSITFWDLEVDSTNYGYGFRLDSGCGKDVTLIDCDYSSTYSNCELWYNFGGTATDRAITIINSTISTAGSCIVTPTESVTIMDSDITSVDSHLMLVIEDVSSIVLQDSTFTLGGRGISMPATEAVDRIEINNCTLDTVDWSVRLAGNVTNVIITESTISSSQAGRPAVFLGPDAVTSTGSDLIDNITIMNNVITATGTSTYGLLIKFDCRNFYVSGNRINGSSHACFIAGENGVAENNVIVCTGPVGCGFFASNAVFRNNTVYAAAGSAFISGMLGGAVSSTAAVHQKVLNNVFVTGTGYAYDDYDSSTGVNNGTGRGSSDAMNDYVDYNCYWKESSATNYMRIGESGYEHTPDSITEAQTAWKTATTTGDYWNVNFGDINDRHSLMIDPQLDSNYQAQNPRLRNAGSPLLIKSDGTVLLRNDIGATKFEYGSQTPTEECVAPPFMDSNGDCKVDFVDFCEFALEWLSCGLENQSNCWE